MPDVIAGGFEATYDEAEGLSVVVGKKIFDVFKEDHLRFFDFDDAKEFKKERATTFSVVETFAEASDTKGLTRKTTKQNVEIW